MSQGQYAGGYGQPVDQNALVPPNQGYANNRYDRYSNQGYHQPRHTFVDDNVNLALRYTGTAVDYCYQQFLLEEHECRSMVDYLHSHDGYADLFDYYNQLHGDRQVHEDYIYRNLVDFIAAQAKRWRRENEAEIRREQLSAGIAHDRGGRGYRDNSYGRAGSRQRTSSYHGGGSVNNVASNGRSTIPRLNNSTRHDPDNMVQHTARAERDPRHIHHDNLRSAPAVAPQGDTRMNHQRYNDAQVMGAAAPTHELMEIGDTVEDIIVAEPKRVTELIDFGPNKLLKGTKERLGNAPYDPIAEYAMVGDTATTYVSVGRIDKMVDSRYVQTGDILEDVAVADFAVEAPSGTVAAVVDVQHIELYDIAYDTASTNYDELVDVYSNPEYTSLTRKTIEVVRVIQSGKLNSLFADMITTRIINSFNEAAAVNFVTIDPDGVDTLTITSLDSLKDILVDSGAQSQWKSNIKDFGTALTRCIKASFSRMFTNKRVQYVSNFTDRTTLSKMVMESHGTFRVTDDDGKVIDTSYLISHGLTDEIMPLVVKWAATKFAIIAVDKVCLTDMALPDNLYGDPHQATPYTGDTNDFNVKVLRKLVQEHGALRLISIHDTSTFVSPILFGVCYGDKVLTRRL